MGIETGEVPSEHQKVFPSLGGLMSTGTGCPEKMESPSLETLRSFPDVILDNPFQVILLEWGVGPDALQLGEGGSLPM